MKFYGILLFLSMAYADRVFRVESSAGFCGLNYRAAHAECQKYGAHLATEAEIETSNTSPCPTCGWSLDKKRICPAPPANVRCKPRCTPRAGVHYDAWCYAGGPVGNCSSALGVELNNNDLYQLRASSEKNDWWRFFSQKKWSANIARLHNSDLVNAWIPTENREGEYLEVKFNDLTAVTGLVTQGASRFRNKMWVTKYKVKYSGDGVNFEFVTTEKGETKVFDGNVNNNGLKRNMFPEPVLARSIRIFPVSYHSKMAMRIEVLGCEMDVYKRV